MKVWEHIGQGQIPGERQTLDLYRRDTDFEIRIGVQLLMGTRMHGSEDALAELALSRFGRKKVSKILIGGLGMGFTLASVLKNVTENCDVWVAELVPKVVEWNRRFFGETSNHALDDERVFVHCGDVGELVQHSSERWDVIILDVDNGPSALTHGKNQALYQKKGLHGLFDALTPSGVLGIWSADDDLGFTKRLRQAGFKTQVHTVRARGTRRGRRHTIWVGQKFKNPRFNGLKSSDKSDAR